MWVWYVLRFYTAIAAICCFVLDLVSLGVRLIAFGVIVLLPLWAATLFGVLLVIWLSVVGLLVVMVGRLLWFGFRMVVFLLVVLV